MLSLHNFVFLHKCIHDGNLSPISTPVSAPSIPVHCCTMSLCYLGAETDDHHRNPNINNKDHPSTSKCLL